MDNFFSGNAARRKSDVSMERMLQNLMELYFFHNPLAALLNADSGFEEAAPKPQATAPESTGDNPKVKRSKVKPVPMDLESLRSQYKPVRGI